MKCFLVFLFLFSKSVEANDLLLKSSIRSYQKGDYTQAALGFHNITNTKNLNSKVLIKANYFMGLSLYNLKLYQAAAYPMIKIVQSDSKKYKQKALEKLIVISNKLRDPHILDYVMSKMQIAELEKLAVDVYFYKLASVLNEKGELDQAIDYLDQSLKSNPDNEAALNLSAISHLKKNQTESAIIKYKKLLNLYKKRVNSDTKKGYTILNLARAYYQARNFEQAIYYYRSISKDNLAYRESLTELGWAYLQFGKTRSALSTIQTLHTPFYENYFEPESLVLRSILLNYLCQFDEAKKAVKSFQDNYGNTLIALSAWTDQTFSEAATIDEINFASEALNSKKNESEILTTYEGKIPFKLTRSILKDFRVKTLHDTYLNLRKESRVAKKYFQESDGTLSSFIEKIYSGRLNYFKNRLALVFNEVLLSFEKNIIYYNQQIKFVNYEILEAKKNQLRIKISGLNKPQNQEQSRNFYIKNGYRYWPFEGEFWIDEIGNFQYSGVNLCEQE
jgi:tetratricopeptide (TPR) repeat protein